MSTESLEPLVISIFTLNKMYIIGKKSLCATESKLKERSDFESRKFKHFFKIGILIKQYPCKVFFANIQH